MDAGSDSKGFLRLALSTWNMELPLTAMDRFQEAMCSEHEDERFRTEMSTRQPRGVLGPGIWKVFLAKGMCFRIISE